jgi:hypothetical protein
MWRGYLKLGGLEVGNSARALGYSRTAECPAYWLKDTYDCSTLQDAVSDTPYVYPNIEDAPWFDPDIADISSRFLGVYVVDMINMKDSTRTAQITQRLGSGGRIGRLREATRDVRVRAILTAKGDDALDVGSSWLDAVLTPGACGSHGDACGVSDMEFFSDCPPARRTIDVYSDWAEARRNLHPNPSLETDLATWFGSGTLTRRTDGGYVGAAYGRVVAADASLFSATSSSAIPVTPGEVYTISAFVRGVGPARTIRMRARFSGGPASINGDPVPIPADWTRISQTFTVPAGATALNVDIMVPVAGTGGDYFDFDAVMAEKSDVLGGYFDGSFAADDLNRYSWAGTVNNSVSILETRTLTQQPEPDSTYGPYVDGFRRFFHSVSCTSGPFTVQEFKSSDGIHVGKLVEFTLTAEVPWMYGIYSEIDVPPLLPTIVQDIAYNLAPYPSAELSTGTPIVATNYSTNPSLETNATGWTTSVTGAIVAGNVASGRVTGELAAVGTASFRSVFTAPGASAAAGSFSNEQEVALGGGAGARYSINIWSAQVVMGGAPVRGTMDVVAIWRGSSGGAALRTDALGTIPLNGDALSVKSIAPPVGATHVLVRVTANLTSWNAGTIVRLYSDALAVTVP